MKVSSPTLFVGAVWLMLTAGSLTYVARFAGADPFGDEWDLMPGVAYQTPYLPWLWAQHNEHRLPLPKLIFTWLLRAGPFDARAGGFATVLVLSAVSFGLMRAAKRLRGQTDYSDAFFPIAFLNWGHFENYLIGFQIGFAMSAGLAIGWLLAALDWIERRERSSAKWFGIFLLLLPLCGAHGLVYAPPLGIASLWLVRAGPPSVRVGVGLACAGAWAVSAAYFLGYQRPPTHPASAGVAASWTIALETLALGWGWCGQMTWPASGAMIAAFIVATGALLAASFRSDPDRTLAFLAVGAGTITLAGGIGWGRSGFGPLAGFAVRYGILMLPLMAAGYLAWLRFNGSLAPMTLFTISVLFLTQHARTGLAEGRANARKMAAFATDLRAGLGDDELARKHADLYPNPAVLAERIRLLRSSGIARYAAPTPARAGLQSR
jgi:hypothetical protein